MAETLISPGVLARENDQSQVTSQPIQAGAAIVGPTVLGSVNIHPLLLHKQCALHDHFYLYYNNHL